MATICIEQAAFMTLIEKVLERVNETKAFIIDKWVSVDKAMT